VRQDATVVDIHPGVDVHERIQKNWRSLMRPTRLNIPPSSFFALMKMGRDWFTQYPKKGERMDTYEPEFQVTSIKRVGRRTTFRTTIGGYHGFFKYGIKEVEAIAPPGANAYSVE